MTTSAYARSAKFLRETSRKKKKSSRKTVASKHPPTASFSVDASSRPSTTSSSHGTQSRDNRVHNEDHRSHSQGPFSQQRTASNEHSRALLPPRFGTHSASTQHSQDTRSSSASSYPPSLQGYSVVTDQEFPLSQLSMSQFSSQSCGGGDGTSHSSSSHHHSQLRQQSQKSHTTSSRGSSHKAVSSSSLFGSGQGGSLVVPPPPFGLVAGHPTPRRSDPSLQARGGAVDAPPPVVGGGMPPPKRKVRPWLNAGSTTIETAMERTKLFAAAAAASVRTHKRSKRMEPPEPRLQEEDHKSQPYNIKTAPSHPSNASVAPRDPQQDMVPEQATVPQASRITHHFKPIDKTTTKDSSDKVDDSQDDDVLSAREQSLVERERSLEEARAEIEKVLQAKLAQLQEAGTDQLARIAQAGDDALHQETKRAGETMARLEAASTSQLAKMGQARDDAVAAVKEACVREMTTLHQAGGAFMRKLKNFKEGVFQECANLPLKLLGSTTPSTTTNLLESPSSMASTDLSQDDCPTTPASKRTRRRRTAVHQAHGLSSSEVNDDATGMKQPRPRKHTATKGATRTRSTAAEPKRKGGARTRSSSKAMTTTQPEVPAVPNAPPRIGRRRKQPQQGATRSPVPTATKKATSCVTPCTKISTQMEEDSPLSVIVEQSSQMESKRRRHKRKHYGSSQESSSSSSLDFFHEPTGDKENGISAFRGKTANKKRAKTKPGRFSFDDDFSFLS